MIWAIGDLHLDHSNTKPMDIFGEIWKNHEEKIIEDWRKKVDEDDLVLLPGDISWGLKLEDAVEDLKLIDSLPGIKCLVKGNHDYWWGTKSKLNDLGLKSLHFIYNDSYIYKNYMICGTRGWISRDSEEFNEQDEKVFNRELNRLNLSLESYNKNLEKIVMFHYPPFDYKGEPNEFLESLVDRNVSHLIYGHLHGPGHEFIIEGNIHGIDVHCVSSDYIDFQLKRII